MERLIEILNNVRPDIDFSTASNLADSGELDSFDIVMIIGELEEAYGIKIGPLDITPQNFNSANDIYRMVSEKNG